MLKLEPSLVFETILVPFCQIFKEYEEEDFKDFLLGGDVLISVFKKVYQNYLIKLILKHYDTNENLQSYLRRYNFSLNKNSSLVEREISLKNFMLNKNFYFKDLLQQFI
jgi:hypothetical protein